MSQPAPRRSESVVFIDGEAFEIEKWAKRHPGGSILLRFLGRDATAVFAAFHGARARQVLRGLRAKTQPAEPPVPESASAFERELAALRVESEAKGLFVASRPWFFARGALILALIALCVGVVAAQPELWPLAALALGLAWQQTGWFSHDLLHGSVFDDRRASDLWGIAFGGLLLGFSADWWKRKHNTHHALPNVLGVDEDIDTLPLLAFDERDLERAGPVSTFLVGLQALTVLPILAFARLNWCVQSVLWALRAPGVPRRGLELASLVAHHAASLGLLWLLPTWGSRVGFFLLSQLLAGLMTGAVFVVGHNARPMLDRRDTPGFYELQCAATQNVAALPGARWFFGGLDRQIEHHLFPTMPRHNHAQVAQRVRELCERHGVPYVERGFLAGLLDVWRVLARVGRAARTSPGLARIAPLENRSEPGA